MKRLLLSLLPVLLLFSCQKKETSNSTVPPTPLKLDSATLNLSGNKGGIDSFMVQYAGNWSVVINPSSATWLKTSQTSGSGNTKVYVNIEQDNKSGVIQTATISVIPDGASARAINITVTQRLYAETSIVQLSKLYGGSGDELLNSIVKTADGGYIAVGTSTSKDGEVSVNKGQKDLWIIKVDASGNKVWEKSYGGSSFEMGAAIAPSQDGGCFIEAQTTSNDGDVSGTHVEPQPPYLVQPDLWILKIDGGGNILWQKTLGGSDVEYFTTHSILGTSDGGCILAAGATSHDGDVSGGHGQMDVWVVKLNSSGSILWQRTLGGSLADEGISIVATPDGGYTIAGFTYSIDGDVSGMHNVSNTTDAWVVKIDATGNKVWQKALGGSGNDMAYDLITTSDGGYLVVGSTNSTDGDVSGFHGGTGSDLWVLKLDGSGNKVWQKTLGGSADDAGFSVRAVSDGFLLSGYTRSTDGDVRDNHGSGDAWVVKIDDTGATKWQKAFGGTGADYGIGILLTSDGNYLFSGYSESNDGEVSGNHGKNDGWILKFKDPH